MHIFKAIGRDVDDTKFDSLDDISIHVSEHARSMLKMMLLVGTSRDLVKRSIQNILEFPKTFLKASWRAYFKGSIETQRERYFGVKQTYRRRMLEFVDECHRDVVLRKALGFKLLTGTFASSCNPVLGGEHQNETKQEGADDDDNCGPTKKRQLRSKTPISTAVDLVVGQKDLVRNILAYADLLFGISPEIVFPSLSAVSSTSSSPSVALRKKEENQEDAQ